ncbi:DNA excision repair protein ERCC-5 [Periophthalmus magnuspinnatus]|uniref:DNA excision repair protein ERCC-5 n=1 Tax=Periophthalmus magnuspinnatus TaxID=409849 RepID=UPI002436D866|nr:DNA excision repair protein ERCC-5 [Periophthalmus magnuspinnatus]
MGVQGLWRLLESTGKPINPETLEGKILAVDISIWLNQAVKGVRDRHGNSVQNAHLLTLFHRICKLLFFRIRPVFVFDGDAPLLKKQTLALRRQRKEELSLESKQTNEKLLRTFLKRQALKAALGDKSQEPFPSLSSVRRHEVDDIYVLPALPAAEEKENSSSEEDDDESSHEGSANTSHQDDFYEDPNSVDINSEEFASLPPEMKHEILKEMKEFSKRRRTMYQTPPERSGDFSQYQLAGLLQRNKLNQRLEGVEKEMSERSAGSAPQVCGDQESHNVEAQRLVSEDYSHYILIKGASKREKAPQTQPQAAAAPWSGSSLSGVRSRAAGKPEPLWRPVCEEDEKQCDPVIQDKTKDQKPTVSEKCEDDNALPPSPRTLEAIRAALNDSSDEDGDRNNTDGSVSPRTLLAIQRAMAEDGGDDQFKTNTKSDGLQSVPQVIIDTSDEDAEENQMVVDTNSQSKILDRIDSQSLDVKDSLLMSSSDDEMGDVIAQRNKALRSAAQPYEPLQKSEKQNVEILSEKVRINEPRDSTGEVIGDKMSTEYSEITHFNLSKREAAGFSDESRKSDSQSLVPELINTEFAKQDANGGFVKPEEQSESEESFVEVSEEESSDEEIESTDEKTKEEEETIDDSSPETTSEAAEVSKSEDVQEETHKREEIQEEILEKTQTRPSASNEWDQLDVEELEVLESSLQAQQNQLREQKQQQERMANTVTGQMCLESQELLRLFGVPYLIAPMEAEAQCAALDRSDHTHGTITDDSDVWLFGGRHVYKNFFSQNKYVEHYQYSDLQNQLGLDRTKLINLAYLLGSDYTDGVPGVGYVTGMEILNEFPGPGLEPLTQLYEWWKDAQEKKRLTENPKDTKVKKKIRELKLTPGFPNPSVAQAYLHPAVDQSESSFSWGRPQLDMIKEFCLSRFGWNSRRTEETLLPVMKQLDTQQTQLRIDSFFRMELHEKQAIRSQRLRRAVTCMKRKEREGEGDEGEEDEEETISPSKSKKNSSSPTPEQRTVASGGGFLASQMTFEPTFSPSTDNDKRTVEPSNEKTNISPQKNIKIRRSSSSSSSEESDSDEKVAMVVAKSVFEGSRRGRGAKSTRGRGRGATRGNAKGKKK